ncbi:hypothetical protein CDL15_Pgr020025 [Punica granatum]|uniref:Pentatricopeptide repeat-containing protein At5g66520-like n=1 Tax=Punica granatum TaxID=22663 RepID=A0A218VRT3_PUNGR|nr:hypothetical protein CDL15_Pgr020025 [Punica granatum]
MLPVTTIGPPYRPKCSDSKLEKSPLSRREILSFLKISKNVAQIHQAHAKVVKKALEQDPVIAFELIRACSGATASVLKACGLGLALREGKEVHGQVVKLGLSRNRVVGINRMEVYGKCGEFQDAWKVFDDMPEQDAIVRTATMSCYFDHGRVAEACALFSGVGKKDTVCWTAMIDGLVRNGEIGGVQGDAEGEREPERSDNSLRTVCLFSAGSNGDREMGTFLLGLALHGKSVEVIETFRLMKTHGLQPNGLTFVSLLNAGSHGGLVEFGLEIFDLTKEYGIEPPVEHYGCMIDLLGRIGRLQEAYAFMESMNLPPDNIMLGSLLSACKLHGDFELAEQVAKILIGCADLDLGTLVLLANLYASFGRWDEAAII